MIGGILLSELAVHFQRKDSSNGEALAEYEYAG